MMDVLREHAANKTNTFFYSTLDEERICWTLRATHEDASMELVSCQSAHDGDSAEHIANMTHVDVQ